MVCVVGKKMLANGRSNGKGRYALIFEEMLRSPAYRSLDCYARAGLIEIKRRFYGNNNGELAFSVRDMAKALNCADGTASRVFKDLQNNGFIKPAIKGRYGNRFATTWILTFEDYYGTTSNDWKMIK